MMEVGGATSSMIKLCGATKSNLRTMYGNFYLRGNIYETAYILMRRKLLHRIETMCSELPVV